MFGLAVSLNYNNTQNRPLCSFFEHFPGRHWWVTGFNSNYLNVDANDLMAFFHIWFDTYDMYYSFKTQNQSEGWIFCEDFLMALLIF